MYISQELAEIEEILEQLKDKRVAQRFVTYDRIFLALQTAAKEFGFPLPKVFQSEFVDRTAITYFITNEEVTLTALNKFTTEPKLRL